MHLIAEIAMWQGLVESLVVQDGSGQKSEVQYVAVVAGQGYVSLTGVSRRRLAPGGPRTLPRTVRPRAVQRYLLLTAYC